MLQVSSGSGRLVVVLSRRHLVRLAGSLRPAASLTPGQVIAAGRKAAGRWSGDALRALPAWLGEHRLAEVEGTQALG